MNSFGYGIGFSVVGLLLVVVVVLLIGGVVGPRNIIFSSGDIGEHKSK